MKNLSLLTLLAVGALALLLLASWGLSSSTKGPRDLDHVIRVLYRQCGRWAMAAQQDNSPIIQLLHANYAAGYLWAIKDIASTSDFQRATGGQEFLPLEAEIVRVQDAATRAMIASCPTLAASAPEILLRAAYTTP